MLAKKTASVTRLRATPKNLTDRGSLQFLWPHRPHVGRRGEILQANIQPCQTEYASPNARFSLSGITSIQKCSRRRSGFYYKPLGFEDVAHLKVVWNLLIPPRWPGLPESEGQDRKPAIQRY